RLLRVRGDRLPHPARPGTRRLWTHPAVSRIVEQVGWRRLVAGGNRQPRPRTATGLTPRDKSEEELFVFDGKSQNGRAFIISIRLRGEPTVRPRRHSGQ